MKFKGLLSLFLLSPQFYACAENYYTSDFSSDSGCSDFLANSATISNTVSFLEDDKNSQKIVQIDRTDSDDIWTDIIRFPKNGLPTGKIWTVEIEFEIPEASPAGEVYFNLEGHSKKGRVVGAYEAYTKNAKGKAVISAYLGTELNRPQFRILSKGRAKVLLKSLKLSSREIPKASEWLFSPDEFIGMKILPSDLGFLKMSDSFLKMSKEEFFPFIDKYGQFKHRNWKDKILSDSDFAARAQDEKKINAAMGDIPNRDRFGGLVDANRKYEATGRFRLQKIDGKWFFITPEGNLFYSFGVNSAGNTTKTPIDGREKYFEDVSGDKYITKMKSGHFYGKSPFSVFDFNMKNLEIKYGEFSVEKYGALCSERMRKWGINSCGGSSNHKLIELEEVPFTSQMSSSWKTYLKPKGYLYTYWHPFPDYFGEDFEPDTKARAKRWHTKELNSPMSLGMFIDNELPWQGTVLVLPRAVLTCPPDQAMKIGLRDFLKSKYREISKLNVAWNSPYSDWDDILKRDNFVPKTSAADADLLAFEEKIYEKYFSVCRAAVKETSPAALYFGCRMAWSNPLLAKVASKYCDAVSYNLYRNNLAGYSMSEGCKDVPIIVGEFHICSTANGVFGGGMRYKTTDSLRNKALEEYAVSAFENPNVVGIHWFKWAEQPTSGRPDGENFACGIVDICDTPHWSLVRTMRRLSSQMYEIRLAEKSSVKPSNDKTTTY